ncbi:hypothetical protein C8F01DRAFT_1319221 [Mycena amicta]|nr:hypothetical protein C8F01DRAFT_1319221 [Mycena amicta]
MKFLAILLATASAAAAQAVPTVTAYTDASCAGTVVDTWSGVAENAFCKAVSGDSLNVTVGTTKCEIDFYSTTNCDGTNGGFIQSFTAANGCKPANAPFSSVRILCITTG